MLLAAIKQESVSVIVRSRDVTNQMAARGGSVTAKTSTQSVIQKDASICTVMMDRQLCTLIYTFLKLFLRMIHSIRVLNLDRVMSFKKV